MKFSFSPLKRKAKSLPWPTLAFSAIPLALTLTPAVPGPGPGHCCCSNPYLVLSFGCRAQSKLFAFPFLNGPCPAGPIKCHDRDPSLSCRAQAAIAMHCLWPRRLGFSGSPCLSSFLLPKVGWLFQTGEKLSRKRKSAHKLWFHKSPLTAGSSRTLYMLQQQLLE